MGVCYTLFFVFQFLYVSIFFSTPEPYVRSTADSLMHRMSVFRACARACGRYRKLSACCLVSLPPLASRCLVALAQHQSGEGSAVSSCDQSHCRAVLLAFGFHCLCKWWQDPTCILGLWLGYLF